MVLYYPVYECNHYLLFALLGLLLYFHFFYSCMKPTSTVIALVSYIIKKPFSILHSLLLVFFFLLSCPVACNFQFFFHNNFSYICS